MKIIIDLIVQKGLMAQPLSRRTNEMSERVGLSHNFSVEGVSEFSDSYKC